MKNKEKHMAFKKSEPLTPEELASLQEESCEQNLKDKTCNCSKKCECDENCACTEENKCNENCTCDEKCECNCANKSSEQEAKYFEMAQRIQAEFDNYRKRTQSAEKDAKMRGICDAVEKFLPVIDSLDNAKRQVCDENFVKALDLVGNQVMQSLSNLGVEKILALGEEFDPNLHNAIMTGSESDKPDDVVLEEFQAGFKLDGKVIRHSVVKVNKL